MDIEAMQQLSSDGAVLSLSKADAMDSAQMRTVFESARRSLQPHSSHFAHAAGTTGMAMLTDLRPSDFWNVAGSKVRSRQSIPRHPCSVLRCSVTWLVCDDEYPSCR
jgi:hypothetical protein